MVQPGGSIRRTVPCVQCRKARSKCEWPEGGEECFRCLARQEETCSGPRRTAAPETGQPKQLPCDICARSKLRCEWPTRSSSESASGSDDTPSPPSSSEDGHVSCVRCRSTGKSCPGPRSLIASRSSTSISPPSDGHESADLESARKHYPKPRNLKRKLFAKKEDSEELSGSGSDREEASRRSAELFKERQARYAAVEEGGVNNQLVRSAMAGSVSLHLMDVHLAQQGRAILNGFDFEYVHAAFRISNGRPAELGQLNELIALSYMLSGAKFSTHSAILGPKVAISLPSNLAEMSPSAPTEIIFTCGLLREPALQSLASKVWSGLARIRARVLTTSTPDFGSAGELVKYAAVMRLANKICEVPLDRGVRRGVNAMVGEAVGWLLEALREGKGTAEEKALLRVCAKELSIREAIEASVMGLPSFLTRDQFYQACPRSEQPLYRLTKQDLDDIFNSAVPISRLEDLANGAIVPMAYNVYRSILQSVSVDVHSQIQENYETWWQELDVLLTYFKDISEQIVADPRNVPEVRQRVWTVLRRIYQTEQCSMDLAFTCHGAIERACTENFWVEPEMLELQAISRRRATGLLSRLSRRLQLHLAMSSNVVECFHSLDCLVYNSHIMGPALAASFSPLSADEQVWLVRGLRFAGFWAPTASRRVAELETVMSKALVEAGEVLLSLN
ncbi:hypothetical protein T439DRAFT_323098 [Meredithblackwellia eburnea MCA 4105]